MRNWKIITTWSLVTCVSCCWLVSTIIVGINVFSPHPNVLKNANCTILGRHMNIINNKNKTIYNPTYRFRIDFWYGNYYWFYSKNFTHNKYNLAMVWLMKNNGTYQCTINSDTHEIVKLTSKTTMDDDNIFIWLVMLIILIICPMGFILFIYISREDRKIHKYDLLNPELIPDYDNNNPLKSPWHK